MHPPTSGGGDAGIVAGAADWATGVRLSGSQCPLEMEEEEEGE